MNHLYLPQIGKGPRAAQEPSGQTDERHPEGTRLFDLMAHDVLQRRPVCHPNDILMAVAQARADDMLKRGYFGHQDPDGHWPNYRVRQAGYKLPDWYPDNDNDIESIGLNYLTAEDVWRAWLGSPVHRKHVLGLDDFFAGQTEVGIGFAVGAETYPRYWVVLSAPVEASK